MIAGLDDLPETSFATGGAELRGVVETVTEFVRQTVERADAPGVIVPLSGGIDSAVTAALCAEALGVDGVLALLLPCHEHEFPHVQDARDVVDWLGIEATTVPLRPLLGAFEDTVAPSFGGPDERARDNAVARLRMTTVYYAANRTGRLVAGTSNRTELLLGYVTKHGDAAADFRPLAPLYKTEVRALAGHLGVPTRIVEKPSTAGFRPDQTDEDDLGAPYGLLDVVLHELVEANLGVEGAADELGLNPARIREYAQTHVESAHKRDPPPEPDLGRAADQLFHDLEYRLD